MLDSNIFSKNKDDYLTAYHKTSYNPIKETYLKMVSFADKNKLVLDEISMVGFENFVVKISILIKKHL